MLRTTQIITALACLLWTTHSFAQNISSPCEDRNQCNEGLACIAGNCLPDGKLTITLSWPNNTDLDIAVRTPSGAVISPDLTNSTRADGGELRRDECYNPNNCEDNSGHLNVEHVSWPIAGGIPEGDYEVFVTNFSGDQEANYELAVATPDGGVETFTGGVGATAGATGPTHNFTGEDTICDADTDRDGICDKWEIEGIDIDEDGTIDFDLPAWGVDPNHKDAFVEVDRFAGETVFPLGSVVSAFANAPVDNPDGTAGIKLHIQIDEEITTHRGAAVTPGQEFPDAEIGYVKYNTAGETDDSNSCSGGWFGTAAERADANCENIMKARKQIFRYGLYVAKRQGTGSSGRGELAGNDFIVSVGSWGSDNTQAIQTGTFMHELGHTLRLGHGSGDHHNCKPNHLSVMNYMYQFGNLYAGRPLVFGAKLPDLNESSLDETVGIQGPASWAQVAYVGPTATEVTTTDASQPIDFNVDGDASDTGINQSVSSGGWPCGTAKGGARNLVVLDEWNSIRLNFRHTGGWNAIFPGTDFGASLEHEEEMTREQYRNAGEQSDSDDDGFNNIEDNCPTVENVDQADADGDDVGDACDECPDTPAPGYTNGCPEQAGDGPSSENPDDETEISADTPASSDDAPEIDMNGDILVEKRDMEIESNPVSPDKGCSTSGTRADTTLGLIVLALVAARRRRRR